jgi:hypothetical protein
MEILITLSNVNVGNIWFNQYWLWCNFFMLKKALILKNIETKNVKNHCDYVNIDNERNPILHWVKQINNVDKCVAYVC